MKLSTDMMAGSAPAPRNQWYVAAFTHELGEQPLQRWIHNEPVVMYRTESGDPVALFDRCPHRGLNLSAGRRVGDTLQCTYHGMRFDVSGRCVEIPSGGPISPAMCVRSYPVCERWQWLWIWMGDTALADTNDIPDLEVFGFGREGWYHEPGCLLPLKTNYLLPFENLLDASHISFLHHGLIDSGDVARLPYEMKEDDLWLHVVRKVQNEALSPLTRKTFQIDAEVAHRTITADAHVPNLCGIRVDLAPVDEPETPTHTNQLMVGITPATPATSYEFCAVAQNFPFVNEDREQDTRNLLMEDVVAMEAIQALIEQLGPERCVEVSVQADAPAMHMRRTLVKLLEAELT